jgi:hypothetical protein
MWQNYDFCAKVFMEKSFYKNFFSLVAMNHAKRIMLENLSPHMHKHFAKT